MKRITTIITTIAFAAVLAANAADNKDNNRAQRRGAGADIDKRIQTINRLDNNASAKQAGIAAVSKETAVPLPTIEAEAKDHPTMGLAGLFMAHELSVKTKKPVDQLIKQRQNGKAWSALARDNGLDLAEIDQKLTRIENALRNPGADKATSDKDRTAVRERDRSTTELDRRIDSLNTLDDKPLVMRYGLAALSKETAVPLPQIEELQKQHTTAGIGDLMVAQELATKTQKSAGDFLKQHAAGKSWTAIIAEANQDRAAIEQKMTRVERAMKDADKQ